MLPQADGEAPERFFSSEVGSEASGLEGSDGSVSVCGVLAALAVSDGLKGHFLASSGEKASNEVFLTSSVSDIPVSMVTSSRELLWGEGGGGWHLNMSISLLC